jgi:CDP-diacylglycerol--glycerol-3-phosphate 3-phosphatidyltransferase
MLRMLPNAITVVRLLLVPLFAWLMWRGRGGHAALTLAVIAASDWVDGWLARRWSAQSRFGAFLDPLADKLAQVVALGFLALHRVEGVTPVPAALLALLVARELVLAYGALRIRMRRRDVTIRARTEGRVSTFLVFSVALAACFGAPAAVVHALAVAATPFIVVSGFRYVLDGRRQFAANSLSNAPPALESRSGRGSPASTA